MTYRPIWHCKMFVHYSHYCRDYGREHFQLFSSYCLLFIVTSCCACLMRIMHNHVWTVIVLMAHEWHDAVKIHAYKLKQAKAEIRRHKSNNSSNNNNNRNHGVGRRGWGQSPNFSVGATCWHVLLSYFRLCCSQRLCSRPSTLCHIHHTSQYSYIIPFPWPPPLCK